MSVERRPFVAVVAVATLLLSGGVAEAQARPPAQRSAPAARAPVPPAAVPVPPPVAVLAMVRSTLLAIDQGNRTGNYTVLRDLAAPSFHDANTAARLAQIFAPLTAGGVDMLGVAVIDPIYTQPARIDPTGKLHVRGVFQIPPRAISFEFLFEAVGGQWKLFAVAVQPI